jgi:hypothetical protein
MGSLRSIPEDEEAGIENSPMMHATLCKVSSERKPLIDNKNSRQMNLRAFLYVISLPGVLVTFFLFIFILRANAPLHVQLWRDCYSPNLEHSAACLQENTLAYRASSIVSNLSWSEKLLQCRVENNAVARLNITSFEYCKEAKFKQLLQVL